MSFSPSQIRFPEYFIKTFNDASALSTYLTLDAISYGDYIAWAINITNSDTITHKIAIAGDQTDDKLFIEVDVPAGAGFAGAAPLQVLPLWMPSQYQYFVSGKENGPNLCVALRETINTGKLVVVSVHAGYV